MFLKTCPRCGIQKKSNEYYKDSSTMDFLSSDCKSCLNRKLKVSNTKYKVSRRSHLKCTYNITLNEYNQIYTKQCGYCYICLTHQDNLKKKLAVDHCHVTGKVRGLLCANCNVMLGMVKDSPEILQRAIDYLKKFGDK